MFLKSLIFFSS